MDEGFLARSQRVLFNAGSLRGKGIPVGIQEMKCEDQSFDGFLRLS